MKIGKRFNQLTIKEYRFYIDNRKRYTDFNTLGLYRSICENEKLTLEQKITIRDYANTIFGKTFEFYQLKDPVTYFNLLALGQDLTTADKTQIWADIRKNQQRILQEKKIRHRNFGTYSKHECGYDHCALNGIMIRQGSAIAEDCMWFDSDKSENNRWSRALRAKQARKRKHVIIKELLEEE